MLRQITNPRAHDQLGVAIVVKVSQRVITGGQIPGQRVMGGQHGAVLECDSRRGAQRAALAAPYHHNRRLCLWRRFSHGSCYGRDGFLWRFTPLSQTIFEPCEDV
jgi:hypothetical protein